MVQRRSAARLCLAFGLLCGLAGTCWAQAERAKVRSDSTRFYREMSSESAVAGKLAAGDVVQVNLALNGEGGTWCEIARVEPPAASGYLPCALLERTPIVRPTTSYKVTTILHPGGECEGVVDQVFDVAGVNDQVAAMAAQFARGVGAGLARAVRISPPQKQKIVDAVGEAFSADEIKEEFRQRFFSPCDLKMLRSVQSGLETPLGVKMRGLEAFANSPEGERQMAAPAQVRGAHSRERQLLVEKIEASSGMTASAIEEMQAMMRGLAVMSGEGEAGDAASLKATIRDVNLAGLLFTYSGATDDELARYSELYASPAFARFNELFRKASLDAIEQRFRKIAIEFETPMEILPLRSSR